MSPANLILRYSAFALFAIVVNLGAQRVCLAIFGVSTWAVMFAIFVGTLAGLVVKYILDKRWIFDDTSSGAAEHTRKFGLYTLMGVVTTLIFWGFEYGFWLHWQNDVMREVGAVIGLTIGYFIKYWLDKRFVFKPDTRLAQYLQ